MDQTYTAHFKVHCAEIKEWEHVHVVGSLPVLGEWYPKKSFPLTKSEKEENTFYGAISVPTTVKQFHFRYLRVSHLDPSENGISEPIMILSKWETFNSPRTCLIDVEHRNGIARENITDQFGSYGGKTQISDGWILNDSENVVYFRIHGEALKFFVRSYANKEVRLKVEPFDVRYSEIDGEDVVNLPTPELPCFSNTDLSVLTREDPIFGDQYFNGSVFRNDQDYLVFRTRTVSLQNLAFRIEFYHKEKRCALSYVLPSSMSGTHGGTVSPVIGLSSAPVGHIHVDYMIVKRSQYADQLTQIDSTKETFGRYWRKRNRMLQIGHRGMGSSYTKNIDQRENTIFSLNEAARRGADYVELDVQLTKDLKTVVYHDFHVLVTVAGRDSPNNTPPANGENKSLQEIAIKDLTLAQLKLLHFEHISRANGSADSPVAALSVTPSKNETDEMHVPFPSLAQVLRNVDENVGLNIEIKYPMYMKDGTHECQGYFEQNKFVDIILAEVAEQAGNRRIVFSCFEPDICTMITKKQHKYPVSFLVVGATNRYMPFQDIRSDSSTIAANFAAGCELLGVNFHSEELLIDRNPITIADRYGLVKFVWGDDLNSKEVQKHFKDEMNVDGLIFDRMGEDEAVKQNVFVIKLYQRMFERQNGINRKKPKIDELMIDGQEMAPYVDRNRHYKDPDVSVAALSQILDLNESLVRETIAKYVNEGNNDTVNEYREAEHISSSTQPKENGSHKRKNEENVQVDISKLPYKHSSGSGPLLWADVYHRDTSSSDHFADVMESVIGNGKKNKEPKATRDKKQKNENAPAKCEMLHGNPVNHPTIGTNFSRTVRSAARNNVPSELEMKMNVATDQGNIGSSGRAYDFHYRPPQTVADRRRTPTFSTPTAPFKVPPTYHQQVVTGRQNSERALFPVKYFLAAQTSAHRINSAFPSIPKPRKKRSKSSKSVFCSICKQRFESADEREMHENDQHPEYFAYECLVCEDQRQFVTRRDVINHCMRVHNEFVQLLEEKKINKSALACLKKKHHKKGTVGAVLAQAMEEHILMDGETLNDMYDPYIFRVNLEMRGFRHGFCDTEQVPATARYDLIQNQQPVHTVVNIPQTPPFPRHITLNATATRDWCGGNHSTASDGHLPILSIAQNTTS
ncbi:unnamed protein product [Caenorhabditis sp. 36 PRJEB53466]|nr:unnamed protein product [Caenorhabditis sp. 36 PRJEB53466]